MKLILTVLMLLAAQVFSGCGNDDVPLSEVVEPHQASGGVGPPDQGRAPSGARDPHEIMREIYLAHQGEPPTTIPAEDKFANDVAEIASINNRDELEAKAQEIKTDTEILRDKFNQTRKKLEGLGLPSKLKKHDEYVDRVSEKFDKLGRYIERAGSAKDDKDFLAKLGRLKEFMERAQSPLTPHETHNLPKEARPPAIPILNEGAKGDSQPLQKAHSKATSGPISFIPSAWADTDPNLGQTLDAEITQEIRNIVAGLGNSPVLIYEFVRNNFEYEPYYGSQKGSVATLWSRSGNDYDLASLLIALLRAAGIPSRYVVGHVSLSAENANLWLGTKDSMSAATILCTAGVPCWIYPNGDVKMEHVWVEAYLPYGNYRGTQNDQSLKAWIPFDPSFKIKRYQPGMDLFGNGVPPELEFDFDDYLSSTTKPLPYEIYRDQMDNFVRTNYQGKSVADVPYMGEIIPEQPSLLPSTPPVQAVISIIGRYSEIPDNLRNKVTLKVLNKDRGLLLEKTFALPEIATKKVAVSYIPNSATDETLINSYGGIKNTPPYLVDMRPVLEFDGTPILVGSPTRFGEYNNFVTGLAIPGKTQDKIINQEVTRPILSGSVVNIGLNFFQISEDLLTKRLTRLVELDRGDPRNEKELVSEFLFIAALKYFKESDEASQGLGALDHHIAFNSGAQVGFTFSRLDVKYIFDIPFSIYASGMTVSIERVVGAWIWQEGGNRDADPLPFRKYAELSDYTGSALEHKIWEDLCHIKSISAIKGIQYAREQGIPVHKICNSGCPEDANVIPSLAVEAYIKKWVEMEVAAGMTVTIPHQTIEYNGWRGATWIALPAEGTNPDLSIPSGYLISGALHGGAIGDSPSTSVNDDILRDFFGESYIEGSGSKPGSRAIAERVAEISFLGFVGGARFTVYSGDPVNMLSGNLIHREVDFKIRSRGLPIQFARTYNSKLNYDGPFGFGWTHSYNMRLLELSGDTVLLLDGDGSHFILLRNDDGSYRTPKGIYFTLTKESDGFTIREKNGIIYKFDLKGYLISITDRNENKTTLNYANGLLTNITDSISRQITLSYNGNGKISDITDFTGRVWRYEYDSYGNLISYKDAVQSQDTDTANATRYEYYSGQHNPANEHNLKRVTHPGGHFTHFVYYSNDMVYRYYDNKGHGRKYIYNPLWRESFEINEKGDKRQFRFDEYGNLIKLVEEGGGIRHYVWDSERRRTAKYDTTGDETRYAYDGSGNVVGITDRQERTHTFDYEPNFGLLTKTRDPRGNEVKHTYDAKGNRVSSVWYDGAEGGVELAKTQATYDRFGNPLTISQRIDDTREHIIENEYDENGLNLVHLRKPYTDSATGQPASRDTYFQYDGLGRTILITDDNGHLTKYTYDQNDLPVRIEDHLGTAKYFEYNAQGQVTRSQTLDKDGNIVRLPSIFAYNQMGQLTETTDPSGNTTRFSYDEAGLPVERQHPNGAKTRFAYNKNGQLSSVTDPKGFVSHIEYDSEKRPVRSINALGEEATYHYDKEGRLTSITNAAGETTAFVYDERGNVTTITDANGHSATRRYDALGRIVESKDALGHPVDIAYDSIGNLARVVDARSKATQFDYDELGRRIKTTDALGRTKKFTYDGVGNLTTTTDGNNSTTAFSYDELNRPTTKTYPDGTNATFAYDAMGRLTSAANPNVTYTYEYDDALGRMTRFTDSRMANPVVYTYDNVGNVASLSLGAINISYHRDISNNLIGVADGTGRTSLVYDPLGRVIEKILPNETKALFDYDNVGRLARVKNKRSFLSTLSEFSYAYDKVGNRLSMEDEAGIHTYTYDVSDQLLSADHPVFPDETFSYDPAGNLNPQLFQYNDANELLATADETFLYDDNGNMTSRNRVGDATAYTYDHENRPVRVDYPDQRPSTVTEYDPFGRRIEKTDSTGTTKYLHDGSSVLAEYDTTGNLKRSYTHGPRIDDPIAMRESGASYFFHQDGLGSITEITDRNRKTVGSYRYTSFGKAAGHTGMDSPYTFTGREPDPDSGLMYYRARYYDPSIGRFTIQDPIGLEGGINFYSYVSNNPVNGVDPLGLLTVIIHGYASHHEGYSGLLGDSIRARGEDVIEYIWSGGIIDYFSEDSRFEDTLREARMLADLRGEGLNVVGHSLGGVISYKAIARTGVQVDNFVTMASPLNLPFTRKVSDLSNIGHWANIVSINDTFSWSSVGIPADSFYFSNVWHEGYWENSTIAETVVSALGLGAQGSNPRVRVEVEWYLKFLGFKIWGEEEQAYGELIGLGEDVKLTFDK